jgi:hypothetical protein
VIKPDKDDMKDVYGPGVTAKDILVADSKVKTPEAVRVFPTTLSRYSATNKAAK